MHLHHGEHDYLHPPPTATRAFGVGLALNATFVVLEAACGVWIGSLALVADAGHNLSDCLGLILAWGASYLARRRPSGRRTYGLRRTSILAALVNALLLYVAVGVIAWEAMGRLRQPEAVAPLPVIVVAAIGFVINGVTALLFLSGHKHDLNLRGAFLHMAADAAVSLGVVIAGMAIYVTGWLWLDPAIGLAIAAMIAYTTWDLLWHAMELVLDSVPRGIDPAAVRVYFTELPGVTAIHDLHIWSMSTTEIALTAHLVKPDAQVDDNWLHTITHDLHVRFGIVHVTIQVETGGGDHPCHLAPDDVI